MAMVNGLMLLEACGVLEKDEYITIRKRIIKYDGEQTKEHQAQHMQPEAVRLRRNEYHSKWRGRS